MELEEAPNRPKSHPRYGHEQPPLLIPRTSPRRRPGRRRASPPRPPIRNRFGSQSPLGSDPYIRATTPPEILEAQETFFRDLPQLLQERPGQWVAYYGKRRLGFGKTSRALHAECVRQGYPAAMIRRIYPYPETDYISAL